MKQTDMEIVKTAKQSRITELYNLGLYDGKEASEALKKEDLLPVETGVLNGTREAVAPGAEEAGFAEEAEKRAGKKRVFGGDSKAKKKAA